MIMDFTIAKGTNMIEIPVKINNKGPYTFNLDIGARITTINESLADSLRINYTGKTEGTTAGGKIEAKTGIVDTFSVGDETVTNHEVRVHHLKMCGGAGFYGVVGHNFLRNYEVTVDYKNKQLSLFKGENGRINTLIERNIVDFEYLDGIHIVAVESYLNDEGPFLFVVDTGAGGTILNSDVAHQLQLELKPSEIKAMSPAGPIETHTVEIKSFKTAFKSFTNFPMLAMPLSHICASNQKIMGGIIGYNILKDAKLIIDYPNKQVGLVFGE